MPTPQLLLNRINPAQTTPFFRFKSYLAASTLKSPFSSLEAFAQESPLATSSSTSFVLEFNEKMNYFDSLLPAASPAESAEIFLKKQRPMPEGYGLMAKIINKMPNTAAIPGELAKKGMSLEGIVSALNQGQSPADILSSVPGFPPEGLALIERMKPAAESASSPLVGSPQVRSPATFNPTLPAGNSGRAGQVVTVSQDSAGVIHTTDIWHTATSDSIFEIMSKQIERVSFRVE